MKILLVITKGEIGGAQVFVLNLAKGLKQKGYEVAVAGGEGNFLEDKLGEENISFKRLKSLKRGFNPFKNISYIHELKKYVEENNFDVVHLNSTNALLGVWGLRHLNNVQKVFTVHGLSLIDKEHKGCNILKNVFRAFFKYCFKYLDKIVFVSKINYNFAIESKLIKKREILKSYTIYNGLVFSDNYFLEKDRAREELGLERDSFICGSIGRLAYQKNYEFLITNHKKIKEIKNNVKLLIIGEGPEREKYEGLIKTYGLERDVILLGERKEASRYLKAFDLFVLPSIFEGLSISLIEAIKSNTKTIASKVGGNEEVIGKENCFKLNSNEDYIRIFKEVLNKEQDIQNKDRFNLSLMVDKYLELYDR